MDSYNEYEHVERHINYSKTLQEINERGWRFIHEIEIKKRVGGRKKYEKDVYAIHHALGNILKPKVILCNNLYSSLVYYLDEMLYYDVRSINTFIIEDDSYPLSFIYFNNSEWNPDVGQQQAFQLESVSSITDVEAALLMTLLQDYETLLQDLYVNIKSRKDRLVDKMFIKLIRIINRLKRRINLLRSSALKIIEVALC